MAKTNISWATHVWNPVTGCAKVSTGCKNCYAEKMAVRLKAMGRPEYQNAVDDSGHWTGDLTLVEDRLNDPYKWRKPRRVFVNSMSDLFHPGISFDDILRIWLVMMENPKHKFLILTKRPIRMAWFINEWSPGALILATMNLSLVYKPPKNIWLGVSVEDQKTADQRIPFLLDTPAAIRFVSCEPLLGPVDFWRFATREETFGSMYDHRGSYPFYQSLGWEKHPVKYHEGIDWVIAGGESGSGARPTDPAWLRLLRDDCLAAGVPFFFKQWGSHRSFRSRQAGREDDKEKNGGNYLDGRKWEEYPV